MEMLRRLPDNVTLEEIAYHISVLDGMERGVRDLEEGRTVTQEEAERLLLECRPE